MSGGPAELLAAGRVLLADGAMGTVLHAAGNPLDRALPELNVSDPAVVRTVHEGYLEAGVDLVQSNTFGANRVRLAGSGLADRVAELNAAGVRIARAAADAAGRPVLVGGSVSPAVTVQLRRRVPAADRAEALREQITALAGAGADVVVLETFGHVDELVEAVLVAAAVCELPVIAQATFSADGATLGGETPEELCRALAGLPVLAIGTNCTMGPQGLLAVVERLRAATDLPLTAQPNAGLPRRTVGARFEYDVETGYFAGYAGRLADAGAILVGGCCGTTPAHLAAAAAVLRGRAPERADRHRSVLRTADRGAPPDTRLAGGRTPPEVTPPGIAGPGITLSRDAAAGAPGFGRVLGALLDAPPAGRLADALESARNAREHGAGLLCLAAAGSSPRAHLSPVTVAVQVQNQLAVESLACVSTWDRTIMALQADLLGAHALGIRRIVCETGSPPLLADYPHVDGVWDVDSVGLVGLLAGLNAGVDHNGLHLAGTTTFEIGARIDPGARDLDAELARVRRKLEAGAHFLLTRPIYETERLEGLLDALGSELPVLACVRPLAGYDEAEYLRHEVPDVHVPGPTLAALRRAGAAAAAVSAELAAELVTRVATLTRGVVIAHPAESTTDLRPLYRAAHQAGIGHGPLSALT